MQQAPPRRVCRLCWHPRLGCEGGTMQPEPVDPAGRPVSLGSDVLLPRASGCLMAATTEDGVVVAAGPVLARITPNRHVGLGPHGARCSRVPLADTHACPNPQAGAGGARSQQLRFRPSARVCVSCAGRQRAGCGGDAHAAVCGRGRGRQHRARHWPGRGARAGCSVAPNPPGRAVLSLGAAGVQAGGGRGVLRGRLWGCGPHRGEVGETRPRPTTAHHPRRRPQQ